MSQDNFQQFIEETKKVGLTEEESSLIRRSVLNFITNNPARSNVELYPAYQKVGSFWSAIFSARLGLASTMAMFFVLSILIGGGVTLGAEKAMPGDILYPVKISFNEEVIALATVSEEAKTNWEIERANRRLHEVEHLASKGSLDAESREKIETNFEVQADKVRDRIKKLESKEDFNAAVTAGSNLETALNAHAKILLKLTESRSKEKEDINSNEEVKSIEARIRSKADETKKNRKTNEAKISAKVSSRAEVSAKNKLKEAESKIEEVGKFISLMEAKLGADATLQAKARLDMARQAVTEGKVKSEAKVYGEAFVLFQKSVRIAQEAKLLVRARTNLNVEVRISDDDNREDDDDKEEDDGIQSRTEIKNETEGRIKVELGL